jgi:hypothetical protein
MNFNKYLCNEDQIYFMHAIVELHNVKFDTIGYTHFRLFMNPNKFLGIGIYGYSTNILEISSKLEFGWYTVIKDMKRNSLFSVVELV